MIGWKTIENFSKPMISRKMMTKILRGNFENSFLDWEKMASRKTFRHFLYAKFFMSGSRNFSFLKNSLVQIKAYEDLN